MELVSLKIRSSVVGDTVVERDIFFVPSQLTLIKPNTEMKDVSMVKIGGEYFAVNGTPAEIYKQIKAW